ncbi:MAG: DUF2326 domain-containing protein [Bacteroidetes bacterium]|nr:DUF2326 domain-containing protein [Bacteroidota bacterium]
MILNRIYTTPEIFDVTFKLGINYIYGEKKDESSLNGIGKSLFLDFIDFCLLSHFERSFSSRLRSAYNADLLKNISVTLEFTINSKPGIITRNFSEPREVVFTWEDDSDKIDIEDARNILGELVFNYHNYTGIFEPEWFRRLISFFIKIQKLHDEKFVNPIKYIKDFKVHQTPVYLFYLLFINNELPFNFSTLIQEKKSINDSIKTIKRFISRAYGVKDPAEVMKRIEHLDIQISEVNNNITTLSLLRNYDKLEDEADKLTSDIKQLYYENASDKKTIEEYNDSLQVSDRISSANVERIYNKINSQLGIKVKKSLDDARDFRKRLSASRRQFINTALEELSQNISSREKIIEEKDNHRQRLLSSLYSNTAYSDLASAYQTLVGYQSQREELISQTRLLNDLNDEFTKLAGKQQDLFDQLPAYKAAIEPEITNFNNVVDEVLNSIYPEEKKEFFSLTDGKRDNLINLKFWENVKHSHGKNIGRTLIFDFSVLFYNIYNNHKSPRFLIHDGIFDSLDKSHLIKTYEFIQQKLNDNYEFQYITTINEGGIVDKKFGDADVITPERMKKEARKVIGPKNKLLKADFYAS